MSAFSPPLSISRFVALDIHRSYLVVGAVDAQQTVVLTPRRFGFAAFASWAEQHLTKADAVVLEATGNAWQFHDQLKPLVGSVTVAHPLAVKLIASAQVKTDARDTIKLARLLAANLVPAVWVPPPHVRELRGLVTHRKRLVQQRTQARNRLHGVLHRHNLTPPDGKIFGPEQRAWWKQLDLTPVEKLRVQQDLTLLDSLDTLVAEAEAELRRLSTTDVWIEQVPFLVQLPGVGMLTAMFLLSAIGDISRFPSAKQLVGYAGLGARVYDSGQTHRGGGITKEGRRDLRGAIVEAAWVAVEAHPHWKDQFERLAKRIGKQKAIVAIARKLLVAVWHVLTEQVADVHADDDAVARKLMAWMSRAGMGQRQRGRRVQLLRELLDRLELGADLLSVRFAGQSYQIPPSSTVARAQPPDST
jgi:transposase